MPDHSTLLADVRYSSKEAIEATVALLNERIRKQHLPDAVVNIDVDYGRPAFKAGPESLALIEKAKQIYKSIGFELQVVSITGGGTDAGFAAESGKPVIEALGLPGFGYHTNSDEYVYVSAIPRRLYLVSRMSMELGKVR